MKKKKKKQEGNSKSLRSAQGSKAQVDVSLRTKFPGVRFGVTKSSFPPSLPHLSCHCRSPPLTLSPHPSFSSFNPSFSVGCLHPEGKFQRKAPWSLHQHPGEEVGRPQVCAKTRVGSQTPALSRGAPWEEAPASSHLPWEAFTARSNPARLH